MAKKEMQVKVTKTELIITIPRAIPPTPSRKTGKTLVVATSHGNVPTTATVDDEVLTVGVNAYIRNKDYVKRKD